MIEALFTVVGAVTVIVALSAAVGYLVVGALNWADYWISANRARRLNDRDGH